MILQDCEAYKKSRVAQGVMKDISMCSVGLLESLDVFQRHALQDVHRGGLPMNGSRCIRALQELVARLDGEVSEHKTL